LASLNAIIKTNSYGMGIITKPSVRKLRGYALDPSLSISSDTVTINLVTYKVPWEEPPVLQPGPIGEYVEVIDEDETGKLICPPLDLNDPHLLAQNGLAPVENNFQFHQQMVYAVAMTTIKNFEKGLGRSIQWCQPPAIKKTIRSKAPAKNTGNGQQKNQYISTLKLFPHAMKEANAFFSLERNALLFGYFPAQPSVVTLQMPNSLVYTCLSHDIIAHEITHAIIHGLYSSYTDDTNPDTYAFHEAFADMVALFQHFSFPELMKKEIAKTRGDLKNQNFLVDLAQQFGTAIGNYGSLRNAIGEIDKNTKTWKKKVPNGDEYFTIFEPHERGQILVSAIFEAFTTIYENRTEDLIRIATGGSGILQQGELHPDLVNRLSEEASGTARHVLRMCIRALDYCPPTDINFGDFLRAIITADRQLVEEDTGAYRVAMIEAFRRRGIYPTGIANISEESLSYPLLDEDEKINSLLKDIALFLRNYRKEIIITKKREDIYKITQTYIHGNKKENITGLYERLITNPQFRTSKLFTRITGLVFNDAWEKLGIAPSALFDSAPSFDIQSLHLASRVTNEGNHSNVIIISLLQKASVIAVLNEKGEAKQFVPANKTNEKVKGKKMVLTGGCNLIFDLDSLALRHAISKPLIDINALKKSTYKLDAERIASLHKYMKQYE
jgi:hypothetical protein